MEEYSSFFDASFDGDVSGIASTSQEDATGNGDLEGYSTVFDAWNANVDSDIMEEIDGVPSGVHEEILGYSLLFRC
jgi:hypothetical protein